jgi:hypothetical protein
MLEQEHSVKMIIREDKNSEIIRFMIIRFIKVILLETDIQCYNFIVFSSEPEGNELICYREIIGHLMIYMPCNAIYFFYKVAMICITAYSPVYMKKFRTLKHRECSHRAVIGCIDVKVKK